MAKRVAAAATRICRRTAAAAAAAALHCTLQAGLYHWRNHLVGNTERRVSGKARDKRRGLIPIPNRGLVCVSCLLCLVWTERVPYGVIYCFKQMPPRPRKRRYSNSSTANTGKARNRTARWPLCSSYAGRAAWSCTAKKAKGRWPCCHLAGVMFPTSRATFSLFRLHRVDFLQKPKERNPHTPFSPRACSRRASQRGTHAPRQNGDAGLRRVLPVLEHDVQDGDSVGAEEAVHPLAARYRDLGRGLAPLLSSSRVVRRSIVLQQHMSVEKGGYRCRSFCVSLVLPGGGLLPGCRRVVGICTTSAYPGQG